MANTTVLNLVKPLGTDHALVSDINANSDKIDAEAWKVRANFSAEYSASSAYAVGAFCTHDGNVYQCNTAIGSGGEAWTAGHWTQISVGDAIVASNQAIAELDKDSFDLAGDTVYTGDVFSAGHGVKRCSSGATNLPVSANGTLISIIRASDIRFLQYITDSGRVFTNTLNGVNWTGWQELACISSVTFTATSVSSTVDISSNVPSGKTIVSAYSSAGNLCCIPYLDNNGKWFLFLRGSASWQTVADASRSFTVAYK